METKSKCQHCDGPLAFDTGMAGTDIDCPHCGMLTRLFLPVAANQKPAPKPAPVLRSAPKPLIEDEIASVGTSLLWIGVICGVIAGLIAVFGFVAENFALAGSMFLSLLFNVGAGWVARVIFHGFAEIIRLLRAIKTKP